MIGFIVITSLALFLGWILKNSVTLYLRPRLAKRVGVAVLALGRAWPWLGHLVLRLRRVEVDAVPAVANPHRTSSTRQLTVWREMEMSAVMRQVVLSVDFVAGLALAMSPITVSMHFAEFMDESRRLTAEKIDQPKPSSDDVP